MNFVALPGNEVHVWVSDAGSVRSDVGALALTLSQEERSRAESFVFFRDRKRYIVAHAFLRDVLSRYLSISAAEIAFETNAYGKPVIGGCQGRPIAFNLSHSAEIALCALVTGREIGVDVEHADVEQGRDIPEMEAIARSHFSPSEYKTLIELPPAARRSAFFACWTRKEAYVKARGAGLSIPLNSFEVDLDPCAEPCKFRPVRDDGTAGSWLYANLEVAAGYAGAVALATPAPDHLRVFRWDCGAS